MALDRQQPQVKVKLQFIAAAIGLRGAQIDNRPSRHKPGAMNAFHFYFYSRNVEK
jgi:hypothetical protein